MTCLGDFDHRPSFDYGDDDDGSTSSQFSDLAWISQAFLPWFDSTCDHLELVNLHKIL